MRNYFDKFKSIIKVFDFMSIQPNDENLEQFGNYLIDSYISEDAQYPPKIWAGLTSDFFK